VSKFNIIRPLTPDEYAGLKANILAHGQQFPIIHDQNGVTLDGHHRERIAAELGIVPKVEQRSFGSDKDRLAFVLSANVRRQSTIEDRKRLAARLYQEYNMTETQIAIALGVSQSTIRDDLKGLVVSTKPFRPKGGRPKGLGKQPGKHKYTKEVEITAASRVLDGDEGVVKVAKGLNVSEQVVIRSVEHERGYREAFAELLDAAAAEKFKEKGVLTIRNAIRIQKSHQDRQFGQLVQAEVLKRIAAADDAMRQHNKDLLKENHQLHQSLGAQGVFTLDQYNALRKAMHPDRIQRFGDARLIEECNLATQLLTEKKDRLIYIPRKSKVRS
jgi:hypothetical protein